MANSELCQNIKNAKYWERFLFSPTERSRVLYEGFRIKITTEKEEDIEKAKKILSDAGIVFDDKIATSFTGGTISPNDRTFRVINQVSVRKLKSIWEKEFRKEHLNRNSNERE